MHTALGLLTSRDCTHFGTRENESCPELCFFGSSKSQFCAQNTTNPYNSLFIPFSDTSKQKVTENKQLYSDRYKQKLKTLRTTRYIFYCHNRLYSLFYDGLVELGSDE